MKLNHLLFSRTPLRGRPYFAYGVAIALPLLLAALKGGVEDVAAYMPPLLLFTVNV